MAEPILTHLGVQLEPCADAVGAMEPQNDWVHLVLVIVSRQLDRVPAIAAIAGKAVEVSQAIKPVRLAAASGRAPGVEIDNDVVAREGDFGRGRAESHARRGLQDEACSHEQPACDLGAMHGVARLSGTGG